MTLMLFGGDATRFVQVQTVGGLTVLVLGFLAVACEASQDSGERDPGDAAPPAPSSSDRGQPMKSASPDAVAPVPEEAGLATLFDGAPMDDSRPSRPIMLQGRSMDTSSGAVVLIPPGWEGDSTYGSLHLSLKDPRTQGKAYVLFWAEKVKEGDGPKVYSEAELTRIAYETKITKIAWEKPVRGKVARDHGPALIHQGKGVFVTGKPARGVYAVSAVIGDKRVLCIGSWSLDTPEYESQIIEAVKGLRG